VLLARSWTGLAALVVLAAIASIATPARAADRVAVLILPEPGTDPVLADNVTEVAIARVAERQQLEMVGTVELRRRLQMENQRPTLGCLDEIACLGRLAVALGVARVVDGSVRALEGGRFLLHMTLTEVTTGRVAGASSGWCKTGSTSSSTPPRRDRTTCSGRARTLAASGSTPTPVRRA
jgi:hypothetical protein